MLRWANEILQTIYERFLITFSQYFLVPKMLKIAAYIQMYPRQLLFLCKHNMYKPWSMV